MSNVVIFHNKELHVTHNFIDARLLWSAGDILFKSYIS